MGKDHLQQPIQPFAVMGKTDRREMCNNPTNFLKIIKKITLTVIDLGYSVDPLVDHRAT